MRLHTEITPRRDGTLSVAGLDGKTYKFKGEPLEGEVTDEETLVHLLRLGTFFPADEDDGAKALALLGDEDGDDEEVSGDPNAQPVEANTAPRGKTRRVGGRTRAA